MQTISAHRARRPHANRIHPLQWLADVAAARRQRAALRKLDKARLDDIGLTRAAAWTEANRPFWDISGNNLR